MKIINDNGNPITTGKSLSEYLVAIKSAIDSELQAISEYDEIISMSGISASVIAVLKEIQDDEKDHLVLLRNLFDDEVEENFKDFGDEDIVVPNEE